MAKLHIPRRGVSPQTRFVVGLCAVGVVDHGGDEDQVYELADEQEAEGEEPDKAGDPLAGVEAVDAAEAGEAEEPQQVGDAGVAHGRAFREEGVGAAGVALGSRSRRPNGDIEAGAAAAHAATAAHSEGAWGSPQVVRRNDLVWKPPQRVSASIHRQVGADETAAAASHSQAALSCQRDTQLVLHSASADAARNG